MAGVIHQHMFRFYNRQICHYRQRQDILNEYSDTELFDRYRFQRGDIIRIVDEIKDDIDFSFTRRGSLSAIEQVLVALRFFATGSFQVVIADVLNIHKFTVSRAIHRVAAALTARASAWIHLPKQVDADRKKRLFYDMKGFPNVTGCIDGTRVRIKAPIINEHEFVDRAGKHSINIQMVCDADLKLINCVVKYPESVHDSRVLQESSVWRAFER